MKYKEVKRMDYCIEEINNVLDELKSDKEITRRDLINVADRMRNLWVKTELISKTYRYDQVFTDDIIKQENIPGGLIDELKTYYNEIDFSNYNDELHEGIITRQLQYRDKVDNTTERMYLARGSYDGTIFKMYAVLTIGTVRV